MDTVGEGVHILGQKQYELVNHLANVQETVSDKKYRKEDSSYSAAIVSVYDYYPFGMLMPGRTVFDTMGMCVTRTHYTEIPHYNWVKGPAFSIGDNTNAVGTIDSLSYTASGGVNATGAIGGFSYTMTGITAHAIDVRTFFGFLSGTATATVWLGTNTGAGGIQLGSGTSTYTSNIASAKVTVGSTTTTPRTITVVVTMPLGSSRSLFSVDSIGYETLTYTLATALYTQCGEPKDHYEFGYNGQMKMNEIAGVGNHNTALFWEYDTRLARRWNRDPKYVAWESRYAAYGNNPLFYRDPLGDFKSKLNATLYKLVNGGEIRKDKESGEYFVGREKNRDGVAIYQRRFGWSNEKKPSEAGKVLSGGLKGAVSIDEAMAMTEKGVAEVGKEAKKATSDLWNSPLARVIVPDFYQVNFGSNASGIVGMQSDINLTFLTRGKDASFFPYVSSTHTASINIMEAESGDLPPQNRTDVK